MTELAGSDWDKFVLRHSKTGNLAVHGIALALVLAAVITSALTGRSAWLLVVVPAVLLGKASHRFFGEPGDRISPRTLRYLAKALALSFVGTYREEVAAATRRAGQ